MSPCAREHRRFSDRHPELSEREISKYDLNAGALKLLNEMCEGKSAIELLVSDNMGARSEDVDRFDSEKIREMFPELAREEDHERIDFEQLKRALPHLADAEDETLQAFVEKIKTTYAYFVRLHFICLLKSTLRQIDAIGIREKIELNFRHPTEHIRFECIGLGDASLVRMLQDIDPNDFEKTITFIMQYLRAKLDKYKNDAES